MGNNFTKTPPLPIMVGGCATTFLTVCAIIDFSLYKQQKNDTNKKMLLGSAIMTTICIGVVIALVAIALYYNKEKYVAEHMSQILPYGSSAARTWGGLDPMAQTQLIKSGFDFAQNNPTVTMMAASKLLG